MVIWAGFILVLLGIGGLVWSHTLAYASNPTSIESWWEGTLQALGVGFIVGGLVDVFAVSGLDARRRRDDDRRRSTTGRAMHLLDLDPQLRAPMEVEAQEAAVLLAEGSGLLDPDLVARLEDMMSWPSKYPWPIPTSQASDDKAGPGDVIAE
jgi:hypothetical protein